ncbi:MAG: AAA family ATPase [Bacteroidetes bacterium]|nr:AAA family ATPase [Bacteroidota bacterium]
MSKERIYLKRASLSGYRTLIDTQIDFKPGLNIIIGKNSSGKTSFLDFLNASLKFRLSESFNNCKSDITISSKHELRIVQENTTENIGGEVFIDRSNESYFIDNIPYTSEEKTHPSLFLMEQESFVFVRQIRHGIPDHIYSWTLPEEVSISINPSAKRPLIRLIPSITGNGIVPRFLLSAISEVAVKNTNLDINNIDKILRSSINQYCELFSRRLSLFSSIKEIKLSEQFNVTLDKDNNELKISNLFFLFYTNNSWLSHNQLSDGSKRVSYIISEFISDPNGFNGAIYLIEEPELGIHPHQLHQLVTFLKEESLHKQIIITTHNPQTLNVLDQDELDSIIICSYTKQSGTTLTHLTERQKEKAIAYMQEVGYLSLYWLHSDLEPDDN